MTDVNIPMPKRIAIVLGVTAPEVAITRRFKEPLFSSMIRHFEDGLS